MVLTDYVVGVWYFVCLSVVALFGLLIVWVVYVCFCLLLDVVVDVFSLLMVGLARFLCVCVCWILLAYFYFGWFCDLVLLFCLVFVLVLGCLVRFDCFG